MFCQIDDVHAVIAQLGERQTEDLKVPGSIPGRGIFYQPSLTTEKISFKQKVQKTYANEAKKDRKHEKQNFF